MLPFELTKDTPYLALSGELWSVFYEYFNKNWPCYKGFLLYVYISIISVPHTSIFDAVLHWYIDINLYCLSFQLQNKA